MSLFSQRGRTLSGDQQGGRTIYNPGLYSSIMGKWSTSQSNSIDRRVWTFTDSIMIIDKICVEYPEYSFSSDYRFYFSDTIPTYFEHNRVGRSVLGKYIIFQRRRKEKTYDYGCYQIDSLSSNKLIFYRDGKFSQFGESITIDLWKVQNSTDNGSNNTGQTTDNKGESSRSGGAGSRGSGGGGGRR